MRLYLDGIFTAEAEDSLTVLKKYQHKLQAVQVEDSLETDVLFVASSSNGIKTDEHWRCTDVADDGWFLPNYTDFSWLKPYFFDSNSHGYIIAPDAKWIGYERASNRIYCRRNLTTGKETFFLSISAVSKVLVHDRLLRGVPSVHLKESIGISFPFKPGKAKIRCRFNVT